jgi:hypothetical protein
VKWQNRVYSKAFPKIKRQPNLTLMKLQEKEIHYENYKKNTMQNDNALVNPLETETDEMEKIRKFLRKKQLENKVLQKLKDDLLAKPSQ